MNKSTQKLVLLVLLAAGAWYAMKAYQSRKAAS
jgi:hypothetical protein